MTSPHAPLGKQLAAVSEKKRVSWSVWMRLKRQSSSFRIFNFLNVLLEMLNMNIIYTFFDFTLLHKYQMTMRAS